MFVLYRDDDDSCVENCVIAASSDRSKLQDYIDQGLKSVELYRSAHEKFLKIKDSIPKLQVKKDLNLEAYRILCLENPGIVNLPQDKVIYYSGSILPRLSIIEVDEW